LDDPDGRNTHRRGEAAMKKNRIAIASFAAALLLAGPALADGPTGNAANERLDRRGERVEQRLDARGQRIEGRLDRRGDRIDRRRGGSAD
jgi:hypothetical protein